MTETQTASGPEQITDNLGRFVWSQTTEDTAEPEPGSVVLTGGDWGTAWQRQFNDGLWHSTRKRGGPKTWEWLLSRRNVRLAYDAEPRPEFETHLTGQDAMEGLSDAQPH